MTFTGFNFRQTLAFVTDGASDVWAGITSSDYLAVGSGGTGYGWTGSAPSGGNNVNINATNDPRIAGLSSIASGNTYRIDVANGIYDVRIGVLRNTTTPASINVKLKVGAGTTTGVDQFIITAASAGIDREHPMDAQGNVVPKVSWATGNQTLRVTVTQGFFTLSLGTTASAISHFAYQLVSPLDAIGLPAVVSWGALTGGASPPLTGQTTTSSAGALGRGPSPPLVGQAATAAQGTVTPTITASLSGQPTTSAIGAATGGPGPTPAGQSLTSSAGALVGAASPGLVGQANTLTAGTISAGPGQILTGQAATAGRGTFIFGPAPAIAGQSSTAAQGSATVNSAPTGLNLSGQATTSAAGTITPTPSKALVGQAMTSAQGLASAPATFVAIAGQTTVSRFGWVVTPLPIYHGINFRQTEAFVTDGPNDFWCGPAVSGSYNAAVGRGFNTTGTLGNGTATNDPHVAGAAAFNGSPSYRFDVPNGAYKLRVAVGNTGGAATTRQARVLVGTGGVAGVDYFDITNVNTITVLQSLDAQGNIWNNTDWPTSNVPIDVVVTQGFVSVNGGVPGFTTIRHFSVAPQGVSTTAVAGQAMAAGQGAFVIGAPRTIALTGQAMTAGRGTIAIVGIALNGQQMVVNQAGPVSSGPEFGGAGQSVTVNQSGPVSIQMDLAAFGLGMTMGQGVFSAGAPGTVTLSGQAMAAGQGSLAQNYSFPLIGQVMTVAVAFVSGVPRHDVSYEISRAFDGGAFDPGGFYASVNPYSTAQQGALRIGSNVPALRTDPLTAGQGLLSYRVSFAIPAQPMTAGQGAAVATLERSVSGQQMTARQGGDVYSFFPGFFAGIGEDVYVSPEENLLYVEPDNSDMLVS